jgi:alkanesulfonate monooxygenase SsuD/methylene tetrahydromethanopterin reductase-like flavin-dependent oxidoreductase (luciferase family)
MTEAGASLPCPDADRSVHRDGRLPRFGVFLPAYVLPGAPPPSGHSLTDYARQAYNRLEDSALIYLMGHPEELIPQFQARIDAGIDELTFNLMTPDPRQLDLFATRIQPHLRPRCS